MFEPSAQIESVLAAVACRPDASAGMQAMMQRASEFATPWQAQLTGIALDPGGRALADEFLDTYWSQQAYRRDALNLAGPDREVIIGSGFHAAVYAAIRVRSGHPRPLVLERASRVGGAFAVTARPTFYLNSRNRPGGAGLAGDQGANLNYLPGAPIQATNVTMAEYPANTDMAFVIRLALAQFADVVTDANVRYVSRDGDSTMIDLDGGRQVRAGRIIDARGVGDPVDQNVANGTTILTFPQFMGRMAGMWPLRAVGRAAVVGGGDSAKCVVESLLGLAPQPFMAAAALDSVDRVDWYAEQLPDTCQGWQQAIRGRYQGIGRYLRPDRFGARRLNIVDRRVRPVALPDNALIDGRAYDLVVVCTGNQETDIDGLELSAFDEYTLTGINAMARRHYSLPAFRVGPHARLLFTAQERADGIADIAANAVSMFRTAGKTAILAATLPALTADD
ncbi:hypothetical protein Rhe02_37590 [Rhizocola hellebori]|uniref:Uncharacterized protein n=1 Tax=Rhizocola hellebori TaxID=1392758 RepID=A0A8J3Q9J3_9ACTN|nr:hypothetical protein [Rhizocola hellebori]GIH05692.1 hypothetical protein Rhe02_37590 [Rhizocola hellebori]